MEITVEARSTTVAADKKSSSRKRKLGSAESAAAATVVKEGRTTQRSQMRRTAGGVSTIVFPKRVNEAERASLTAQYAPLMRAMFHMGFTGDVYAHQASCAELAQAACFYGSTAPDTTPTFAIFHEMGLGKTVSAIIAYAYMVFTVSRTLLRVNNGSTDGSGGGGSALDGTAIKGDSESTLKILEGVASYSSPSTLLPSTSTSASISASLQRALASAHAELRGEDLLRDGPVSPEELAAARRYAPLLTRPLLIIVPTSVLSSWLSSCHRFLPSWCTPDTCVTAYGKEEVRRTLEDADRQDTELRVVITTYKMVQTHGEAFSRVYWSGFVLDEVHCLRSPTTDTFRAVRRVLEVARDRPRLALTGTPVNNSAEDLRVIAGLLGVPSLAHLLSHRLLKADVLDLPPVRHRYFAYVISELQREAYEILLEAVNRAHRFYSRMLRAQPRVHALCEAARNWYVSEVANLQMACLHLSLVRGRLLSTRLAPKLLSSEGAARLAALTAFPAPSLPDPDGTKDTCAVDTTEGSCAPVKCSMRVTEEDDIVTIVGGDRKGAPAPVAAESESEYSDESHSQREGAESGEREEVRLRDRLLGALKSGSDDGIEGEGGGGGGGGRGECKRSILDDTLERYWTGEAVDVDSESAEAESEMVISLMHIIRHHFTKPTSKQRGLVITSQWVKVLRGVIAPVVRKYFQRFLNMELLDGSVTARKRGEIVERFQNGSTHILLLSMSIAQGITLTRGTRMVFVSAWGNPQVHLQASSVVCFCFCF